MAGSAVLTMVASKASLHEKKPTLPATTALWGFLMAWVAELSKRNKRPHEKPPEGGFIQSAAGAGLCLARRSLRPRSWRPQPGGRGVGVLDHELRLCRSSCVDQRPDQVLVAHGVDERRQPFLVVVVLSSFVISSKSEPVLEAGSRRLPRTPQLQVGLPSSAIRVRHQRCAVGEQNGGGISVWMFSATALMGYPGSGFAGNTTANLSGIQDHGLFDANFSGGFSSTSTVVESTARNHGPWCISSALYYTLPVICAWAAAPAVRPHAGPSTWPLMITWSAYPRPRPARFRSPPGCWAGPRRCPDIAVHIAINAVPSAKCSASILVPCVPTSSC